jgi:hypothetical protein
MTRSSERGAGRRSIAAAVLVLGLAGIACGALLAGSLDPAATPYEVMGLHLGDSREAVARAHPDLRLEAVAYEDPRVGTRYALTHGSVATLRYEGRKAERTGEDEGYSLEVRLTGDGRLYEATAQILDRSRTCAGAIAEMTQQLGAPRIDERPSHALWSEASQIGPRLEIWCLGEGLYRLEMADPSIAEAHREQLESELETAVAEALQIIGEPPQPPAGGPPPQLGGPIGSF